MPGPTHIVDLLKQGSITDFHRTNMFEVVLHPPVTNDSRFRAGDATVELGSNMVKQIAWPGVGISELPIKRMGLTVQIPAAVSFSGKMAMTIRDDEQSKVRAMFLNWQRHHYGHLNSGRFNVNLRNLIRGTVHIYQLDSKHDRTTQMTLYHAWPNEVGELDLNHESEDSAMDFNVQIAYSYAKETNKQEEFTNIEGRIPSG